MLTKILVNMVLSIILSALSFLTIQAQQPIKIQLNLEPNTQNGVSYSIFTDEIKFSENEKSGKTPNGLLILVKRDENNLGKFYIWIDVNNDGSLTDEKKINLAVNEKTVIEVKKAKDKISLPFELSVEQRKKGVYLWWKTNVQASGEIKTKNCSAPIYLQDLNANGMFEHAENGTSLQIDRNLDGKIWGKEENLESREIIDLCGENFLITTIALDGSSITIERTDLQIAKVGVKSPKFDLSLLSGKNITSEELIGKPMLLDFWASWCVPCVEKLPEAKNLEKEIAVFYINTDEKNRISIADKIITNNNLRANSMMKGLGEADYLWKTFARLNNSLPFYVLIDGRGIVVYADDGGEKLKELKAKILELQK